MLLYTVANLGLLGYSIVDIIVTTPKFDATDMKQEVEFAQNNPGSYFVRTLSSRPKHLNVGDKVWYVQNGLITGYAIVSKIDNHSKFKCEVTGKVRSGCQVWMKADTWVDVQPRSMKGFQGFRYYKSDENNDLHH